MRDAEEINVFTHFMDKVEEKQAFTKGIALGLFYGIIGNIAISHYYGAFESLLSSKLDAVFWANLLILIITMTVIAVVSLKLYKDVKSLSKEKESLRQEVINILKSLADREKQRNTSLNSS